MRLPNFLPALALAAVALCQQPAAILIQSLEGKAVTVTAEDLTKLPHHPIKASEHGTPATFDGVLLSDVLAKVNVPTRDKLRGKALAQYLLVEAADGYRAVFALTEFAPDFTDRNIYW
jgi:hypothetical protein